MPSSPSLRHAAVTVAVAGCVVVAAPAAPAQAAVGRCGMRIDSNFTLDRDLRNCPGDGLVVVADNITVRLGGHIVEGRSARESAGVRVAGVSGVTVTGGVIRRFGKGILLTAATDGHVVANRVADSFDEGIFTDAASVRTRIAGNQVSASGIASGATWADGIDARGDGLLVRGNTVLRSRDDGIDAGGIGGTLDGNRVDGSGQQGIDVDGHDYLVQNNTSTRNGNDGIGVGRNATKVTIRDNVTNDNVDMGIQPIAGTAVDGGGNRASGNGDPRQCTQVVCSPWTPSPTDARPHIDSTSGSPRYLARLGGAVLFRVKGSDAEGPVSYQVRSRTAAPGMRLASVGTKVLPIGVTSVSRRVRAGTQVCHSARAVDDARQLSAWSTERCTAAPIDDRGLVLHKRGVRARSRIAVGGTFTELRGRGASLSPPTKVVGASVAVWVVKAPGQGRLDVRVGARRIGHIDLRANSPRRRMVSFALPRAGGTLHLVSTSSRPARVDAVTNLR